MSFNHDLEQGYNKSSRYRDYPEFEILSGAVDSKLNQVNKILLDPPVSDTEVTDKFKEINESVKHLQEYLDDMQKNKEDVEVVLYFRQKEALQVKLIRESLTRFQRLRAKVVSETDSQQQTVAPGQTQLQVQISYEPINAEELEQQLLAIAQREEEIHQIHQDTMEINEIFANLLNLVTQQQFLVDNIEENLSSYSADVRGADHELRRAARYQRRSTGRMCYCLVILSILAGLILLVLLI